MRQNYQHTITFCHKPAIHTYFVRPTSALPFSSSLKNQPHLPVIPKITPCSCGTELIF